jgi:signal transduction histidine kinase
LSQPDHELSLTIRDDGVGFDVQTVLERAAQGTGLGLLGMQERVQFAGGQIKINSTPNQGTEIQVHLPIPSPEPVHKTRKEA